MRDGNTSESTQGVSNSISSRSSIVHLQFLITLDTSARPGPHHPLVTPSILKADAHRRVAGHAESAVHPGPGAADADLKGIGAAECQRRLNFGSGTLSVIWSGVSCMRLMLLL